MPTKPDKKTPAELLHRLETRHDDLLARLDELNGQVEAALREASPSEGAGIPE